METQSSICCKVGCSLDGWMFHSEGPAASAILDTSMGLWTIIKCACIYIYIYIYILYECVPVYIFVTHIDLNEHSFLKNRQLRLNWIPNLRKCPDLSWPHWRQEPTHSTEAVELFDFHHTMVFRLKQWSPHMWSPRPDAFIEYMDLLGSFMEVSPSIVTHFKVFFWRI